MRLLLFLQRLTFICNLLFILCMVLRFTDSFITSQELQTYIIILGWFVSLVLNITVNVWEMILLTNRRQSVVPNWLRSFNLVILCFQILFFSFIGG